MGYKLRGQAPPDLENDVDVVRTIDRLARLLMVVVEDLGATNARLEQLVTALKQPDVARSFVQAVEGPLTVDQVANHLRCTQATVRRYIKKGDLDAFQVGRGLRIDRAEVERFLRANRIDPAIAPLDGRVLSNVTPLRGV